MATVGARVQFDLFGAPLVEKLPPHESARPPSRNAARVLPLPVAALAELTALAAQLPAHARFGTSSWSFPGWAGMVFAEAAEPYSDSQLARQGLAAYAAHPLLRAVGIDRTFYAPITESQFRSYAKQARTVRPDFQFLVKAPMLFTGPRLRSDEGQWTDNAAFLNADLALTQFVQPAVTGLAEMCGPLVFQFPPLGPKFTQGTRGPQRFADALAEFLLRLPKLAAPACYAVEVRDPELLTDDYLAALCAGGATHCIAIHARMPSAAVQSRYWREAGRLPLVIRWSLHSGFKYEQAKERYAPFNALVDEDPSARAEVAQLVLEASKLHLTSMVIANNKAEGSAPLTLRKLAELLTEYGEGGVVRS
jgi:uncharacterized protein YecE (DUF72 family)